VVNQRTLEDVEGVVGEDGAIDGSEPKSLKFTAPSG
jgi:hypothetical protein